MLAVLDARDNRIGMDARAWQTKGAERYRAGDLAGAAEAIAEAARADPSEPDYPRNLAELARGRGDLEGAARWLRQAAEATRRAPTVERLNLLAAAWLDLGDRGEALDIISDALALQDNAASQHLFGEAVRGLTALPERHRATLVRALQGAWRGTEGSRLAVATLRKAWPATAAGLASDPLLAAVLALGPVRDPILERRLTALRRALLLGDLTDILLPLQAALAQQCYLNEYAWAVTREEVEALTALREAPRSAANILRLAAYQSLASSAGDLAGEDWGDLVSAVVRRQLEEPARERVIAAQLPAITPIRPGVSETVRAMYEANPYPRWTVAPAAYPQPLGRKLRTFNPRGHLAPIPNEAAPSVLIAGCGTGLHAVATARSIAGARVLAVDLSRASLGYAARKAAELGVTNLTFAQADLLELRGQAFDVIEASGSLQALADPDEGVKVLAALLRPGGLFRFGLYSAAARAGLGPARELGKQYPPTPEGIRELRRAIMDAPEGDPLRYAMSFGDFYSVSDCRDLLLHVMEHQHTTADLARILANNDLRLLGFSLPQEVLAAYRARFPSDPAAVDLDNWATFEADHPATFAGMYQFWAQKA